MEYRKNISILCPHRFPLSSSIVAWLIMGFVCHHSRLQTSICFLKNLHKSFHLHACSQVLCDRFFYGTFWHDCNSLPYRSLFLLSVCTDCSQIRHVLHKEAIWDYLQYINKKKTIEYCNRIVAVKKFNTQCTSILVVSVIYW